MPDVFDHPNKTCNFKFCWPIILFYSGEEPKNEEDRLNGAFVWPTAVGQGFVDSYMKYYCSKAEFLEGIQVYPQRLVRVVVDKGRKMV